MRHGPAMHQKFIAQMELPLEDRGETPTAERSGEAVPTTQGHERLGIDHALMERVVERGNLLRALQRVQQNKGSPGVDGRTVEELPVYLREHWPAIRAQLLTGHYQAKRREASGASESGRWNAHAWYSDRGGPVHSAGRVTGAATDDRPNIF